MFHIATGLASAYLSRSKHIIVIFQSKPVSYITILPMVAPLG